MKGSIAIQVLPVVKADEVFDAVDKVIEYISSTGLDFEVGPFETTVDGEFSDLMEVIKKSHEIMFEEGVGVSCYIKTWFHEGESAWTINDKVAKYR